MTFVLHLRLFETFVYKVNKKGQVLEDNTFFRDDPSKKCSCGVSLHIPHFAVAPKIYNKDVAVFQTMSAETVLCKKSWILKPLISKCRFFTLLINLIWSFSYRKRYLGMNLKCIFQERYNRWITNWEWPMKKKSGEAQDESKPKSRKKVDSFDGEKTRV